MITGEMILEISGNREPRKEITGLNMNISIEDIRMNSQELEITYNYTADYDDKVGNLKLRGILLAKEDAKLTKEILEMWEKNKRVPDAYAEIILSAINYSGSANGTLLARVLGLTAPLVPPKIQLSKQQ